MLYLPHDPLTLAEITAVWHIFLAAIFGAALGLERSVAGKHAGMRTYALVSMGSALFVSTGVLASYTLAVFPAVNPTLIASSVVVGIGFIGAGLAAFRNEPVEITTAAGIWVAAAIGLAEGFGLSIIGCVSTFIAMLIFRALMPLEARIRTLFSAESPASEDRK